MKVLLENKGRFIPYVLSACFLLLVGCSPIKVLHTQEEEGFSLNKYQTYSFFKENLKISDLPDYGKRIEWIKNELKNQLANRGLKQNSDAPDLLINIGIVIEEKIQTRETDFSTDAPLYIGTRSYHWESEEIETGRYHEGTFTIDFVDANNEVLVWEGVVQGVIAKKDEKSKQNIAEGTAILFEKIK